MSTNQPTKINLSNTKIGFPESLKVCHVNGIEMASAVYRATLCSSCLYVRCSYKVAMGYLFCLSPRLHFLRQGHVWIQGWLRLPMKPVLSLNFWSSCLHICESWHWRHRPSCTASLFLNHEGIDGGEKWTMPLEWLSANLCRRHRLIPLVASGLGQGTKFHVDHGSQSPLVMCLSAAIWDPLTPLQDTAQIKESQWLFWWWMVAVLICICCYKLVSKWAGRMPRKPRSAHFEITNESCNQDCTSLQEWLPDSSCIRTVPWPSIATCAKGGESHGGLLLEAQ